MSTKLIVTIVVLFVIAIILYDKWKKKNASKG